MKRKRRIVVMIATSADGYIARADGSYDWLDRPRPKGNYGYGAFFRSIDTVLWGRKTYEIAVRGPGVSGGSGMKLKNYVFTHHPPGQPAPEVEFVTEPPAVFAPKLRAQPGKDIWMMGGGGLIASFLDAGEIDDFLIHVIPVFIGEGIPLIESRPRTVNLALASSRRFPDGVVRLHYRVLPGKKAGRARLTPPTPNP